MRRAVLMLCLACLPGLSAQAAAGDERAVLASFNALLQGLGRRDAGAMLAHSLPGGRATLMREGKPLQMSLEELAQRVTAPGEDAREETISEPLVRVDGGVAIVWARFEFKVNGRLDHCGRDQATLVKIDGQWLVAAIADDSTKVCRPPSGATSGH